MQFPQVLLIGNGINRAFGGSSWDLFLNAISTERYKRCEINGMPMPLQAILRSENTIAERLKYVREQLFGELSDLKHREYLQALLNVGFDSILTTNYSYELELAGLSLDKISGKKAKDLSVKLNKKDSPKYQLQTFNEVNVGQVQNRIYHIHGEARKPSSMVLGHYYYGNLLCRIKNYLDSKRNSYTYSQNNNDFVSSGWIDDFIIGDVYVLGFGLDLSEADMWWLLERKNREKAKHGKIYFFAPVSQDKDYKKKLLQVYKNTVEIIDLGFKIDAKNSELNQYQTFYKLALEKIKELINIKKGE